LHRCSGTLRPVANFLSTRLRGLSAPWGCLRNTLADTRFQSYVLRVTLATALVSRTEGLTVEEFLGQWLAHVRGRVRPRTFCGYESLLRINAIPALGPCRDIVPRISSNRSRPR
jgi:hypothetical protein